MKWEYDRYGTIGYNTYCAFEATLINLNIISYEKQSGMREVEVYDKVYGYQLKDRYEVRKRYSIERVSSNSVDSI